MITDQQFQELQKRINELEKTVKTLSMSLTELRMTSHSKYAAPAPAAYEPKRDRTRYVFNGRRFSKRALVLAGIKAYVVDQQVTSSEQLLEAFPTVIQGSLGLIRPAEEAEMYENAKARFFFRDDEVLRFNDGIFVICKEWTAKNIGGFIQAMENNGYKIKVINR